MNVQEDQLDQCRSSRCRTERLSRLGHHSLIDLRNLDFVWVDFWRFRLDLLRLHFGEFHSVTSIHLSLLYSIIRSYYFASKFRSLNRFVSCAFGNTFILNSDYTLKDTTCQKQNNGFSNNAPRAPVLVQVPGVLSRLRE